MPIISATGGSRTGRIETPGEAGGETGGPAYRSVGRQGFSYPAHRARRAAANLAHASAGNRSVLMAVYTEVTDDALTAFLTGYDIGTVVAFRGIAEGVENSNYSLRTTGGDFILTLYEKRVDPAELPWFLGLMEHLARHGIASPLPVHGRDGAALRRLCGRHAAITTFLPGVWPRRVRPEHCGPLGAPL